MKTPKGRFLNPTPPRTREQRATVLDRISAIAILTGLGLVYTLMIAGEAQPAATRLSSARQDRITDLRQDLSSLGEEIRDLGEPVEEFAIFDQCMHLIGVSRYGSTQGNHGFVYGDNGTRRRPALAMDMRGFDKPQFQLLAFPGEEPPSIECNEDAGGLFTN